jgi:DNA-3-methyladenine glycosylase I
MLEINQAGLSWITILKKADIFLNAYVGFDIARVANYGEKDRARLLTDSGIIRNRLKVNAAIVNAQRILELQKEYGSFRGWLDKYHPLTRDEWATLFKKTFVFTGGEIVNEFLISAGYLAGAHEETCHIYKRVASLRPAWMRK